MASRIESDARRLVKALDEAAWNGISAPPAEIIPLLAELRNGVVDSDNDSETTTLYRKAATDKWHRDGEIEIDDNAVVSVSDDPGAYVAAWVWVRDDEVDGLPEIAEEAA